MVFVLEFRRGTNTSYENHTVLARVGYTNAICIDHSIGSDDADGTYIIKVSISASGTGASIYQGARGSAYSGARIKQVIGIKLTKNLDNITSLDETLLYSGNDLVVADPSNRVNYTLSDNYNNYDYIILEIVAPSAVSSAVNYCTITVKMPLYSTLHHPIFSPSMYNPTIDTKYDYNGFVEFNNDNIIQFAPRFQGRDIQGLILSKVIGIKKNSLSTADIAEMAMPSSVYTTLTEDSSGNVIAPADGYLQIIYDVVTNNVSSVGLDDYVVLIPAGFNGATDCGTELYAVSKEKTTKLNIAVVLRGHYTVKFIYSIGSAKALGLI